MNQPPIPDDTEQQLEVVQSTDVEPSEDSKALEEVDFFSRQQEAELTSFRQDVEERKKYAHRTFCLIAAWLVGVFILLLLQGFSGINQKSFVLDKTVLLAVLGSTTINVLGIFITVMHYLFPSQSKALVTPFKKKGKVAK